jgi:dTDP-L-rhamnose 4-epimerase
MRSVLPDADQVVHFAAAVGVGQSQYQIRHYVDSNIGATGILLDLLAHARRRRVKKILIASSMSAYGEGAYECGRCGRIRPSVRNQAPAKGESWDPPCPRCGQEARPVGTREEDPFICASVYAVTKMAQEELVMNFGRAYQVPCVALRFFNVYGPRQSLSNPYTGVAAIFISRAKNQKPPVVYEDGGQTRDFIHVRDIVQGCLLALTRPEADQGIFNLGTGNPTRVLDLAFTIARN